METCNTHGQRNVLTMGDGDATWLNRISLSTHSVQANRSFIAFQARTSQVSALTLLIQGQRIPPVSGWGLILGLNRTPRQLALIPCSPKEHAGVGPTIPTIARGGTDCVIRIVVHATQPVRHLESTCLRDSKATEFEELRSCSGKL